MRQAVDKQISGLARLMVSTADQELFGRTEFDVRERVLRIGAKVYEEHVREKNGSPLLPSGLLGPVRVLRTSSN